MHIGPVVIKELFWPIRKPSPAPTHKTQLLFPRWGHLTQYVVQDKVCFESAGVRVCVENSSTAG